MSSGAASRPGISIGPDGVAVGWGKVFAATSDGVIALNASKRRDGLVPSPHGNRRSRYTADRRRRTSPGGDRAGERRSGIYVGGDRGWLFALNAATGATDWAFDTVASSDLWGNPAVNSGGGAWYPPSIDVAANRVYWGTANPAPFPARLSIRTGRAGLAQTSTRMPRWH